MGFYDFDLDDCPEICCNCKYEDSDDIAKCNCEQRAQDIRNGCEKKEEGVYCCYFKGYFEN